jgi:putative DNA primase/helicase
VTIPAAEQDRKLVDKLRAELPGILRWAVDGCLAWQQLGLGEPPEVQAATSEYRDEMDVIGAFIEDCCVTDPSATAKGPELYQAYRAWCETNREQVCTSAKFARRLKERGITQRPRSNGQTQWGGLGLREQRE